jgi:hypothetical protein
MVTKALNGQNGIDTMAVGNLDNGAKAPNGQDWDHPFVASTGSDPSYTIRCWRYACPSIEGTTVRIPTSATPAQGTDKHLAVLDQTSNRVVDLYKTETIGCSNGANAGCGGGVENWQKVRDPSGGTLWIGSGGYEAIDGDGRGVNGDGATAAKTSLLAGPIQPYELANGSIPHVLFGVIGCVSGQTVYPAQGKGHQCSDPTNAPPTGQRFELALSDAQIDALPGPVWRKAIWKAMAHYGVMVGDTGGDGTGLTIQPISDHSFGSTGSFRSWASAHVDGTYVTASGSTPGKYYLNLTTNRGFDLAANLRAVQPNQATTPTCP